MTLKPSELPDDHVEIQGVELRYYIYRKLDSDLVLDLDYDTWPHSALAKLEELLSLRSGQNNNIAEPSTSSFNNPPFGFALPPDVLSILISFTIFVFPLLNIFETITAYLSSNVTSMAANTWLKPLNNILGAASSYYHGYPQNTHSHGSYQNIPDPVYSPSMPLKCNEPTAYPMKPPSGSVTRHRKTFDRVKKHLKIVSTLSAIVSSLLTLFMEGSMIYMIYKWLKTRHVQASDYSRSSPWAEDSVVWPTFMLLAASVVTFVLCLAILIATCCRSKKKSTFNWMYNAVHIIVWVIVSVLYRLFKTEKDLWGWTCSQGASEIQDVFKDVVNFDGLCKLQSTNWQTSIAEFGSKIACGGLGWYLKSKESRVRKWIVEEVGEGFENFLG